MPREHVLGEGHAELLDAVPVEEGVAMAVHVDRRRLKRHRLPPLGEEVARVAHKRGPLGERPYLLRVRRSELHQLDHLRHGLDRPVAVRVRVGQCALDVVELAACVVHEQPRGAAVGPDRVPPERLPRSGSGLGRGLGRNLRLEGSRGGYRRSRGRVVLAEDRLVVRRAVAAARVLARAVAVRGGCIDAHALAGAVVATEADRRRSRPPHRRRRRRCGLVRFSTRLCLLGEVVEAARRRVDLEAVFVLERTPAVCALGHVGRLQSARKR